MESSTGLYNAQMNVATKLNRDLLLRYISENRIDALIALFEVQFDALRRAEALQMLHVHEIRMLKHQLAGREAPEQEQSRERLTVNIRGTSRSTPVKSERIPKPAKRNPELEIEL